jgi:hypothetical protein
MIVSPTLENKTDTKYASPTIHQTCAYYFHLTLHTILSVATEYEWINATDLQRIMKNRLLQICGHGTVKVQNSQQSYLHECCTLRTTCMKLILHTEILSVCPSARLKSETTELMSKEVDVEDLGAVVERISSQFMWSNITNTLHEIKQDIIHCGSWNKTKCH